LNYNALNYKLVSLLVKHYAGITFYQPAAACGMNNASNKSEITGAKYSTFTGSK